MVMLKMNDKPSLQSQQIDEHPTNNTDHTVLGSRPTEPVCSDCGSSYPTFCRLKRKYYQSDDDDDDEASSSYFSENDDDEEDYDDCYKKPVRRNGRAKKSKIAQVPHLSDKRQEINNKMRALRELIPNCNKVDTASMLDEAIEYLKALQLQAQIMSSMGCMSQMMMLHMRMQQMLAMRLPHFSPLTSEMGMLMATGVYYNQTQVPTSIALDQGTGFTMVGLQGQVLPMTTLPSPHSTSFPGVSYAQSVPLGNVYEAAHRS